MAVFFPLILIFIYGYALNLDADHSRIGIVDEQPSYESILLRESFTNSPYFDVAISNDRPSMEALLLARKIGAFIVIPTNFETNLLNKEYASPLQIITDGSETNNASLLLGFTRGAWANWLSQRQLQESKEFKPPVQIVDRNWYNQAAISHNSIIPGSIAVIMTVIGTYLTALVVAREWDRGTFEGLMPTPITIMEIIFGKLIPYYFLALISMLVCVIFSIYLFHVPFRGSFWLLFVVSSLFLFSTLSIGLFISTLTKNQLVATTLAVFVGFLPAQVLSGFVFEIHSMPKLLQVVTYAIPARYFVNSLQSLFLVGNVYGLIFKNCIGLLGIASFFIYMNFRILKKRLD
jgi:ABC-2 type transport system permease protein